MVLLKEIGSHAGALLLIASLTLGAGRPDANPQVPPSRPTEPSPEEAERESLKGLTGIEVVVEPLDSEIEQVGLSAAKLQEDVRQRLLKAGIKVLKERERPGNSATGLLTVRLETLHDRIGRYFYTTDVWLAQRVKLESQATAEFSAVTWKKLGTVSTIADDNVKHMADQALRKVDQFIKDYLAANPDRKVTDQRR